MLRSYLTLALRNLQRRKGHAVINIFGLALGMAICMLVLLFVRDEFSYDRYHENADRLYRVYLDRASGEDVIHWARSPSTLGPALKEGLPEVEHVVRVRKNPRTDLIRYEDQEFYEPGLYFADAGVFEVFSFPLLRGDPRAVLQDPNSIVLTEAMAEKYFGAEDPIGKVLTVENQVEYTVTGILGEVPSNSHFVFDFLASFESLRDLLGARRIESWVWVDVHTYVLLPEQHDAEALADKFPAFLEAHAPQDFHSITALRMQPITDIHLYSKLKDEIAPNSDARYTYILSTVALFILLIACVNFMNLATAYATRRAHEVGMRKVLGARHAQLVRQFLGESVLLAILALGVAVILVWLLLPLFNALSAKSLTLGMDLPATLLGFLGITVFVGLVAGSYPALYLSTVQPVVALKGGSTVGTRRALIRKALVVGQFAITILLLIATAVITDQVDYLRGTTLGFNKEQVVIMPLRDNMQRRQAAFIKEELLQHPGVLSVTASSSTPGGTNHLTLGFRPEGVEAVPSLPTYVVDFDFVETYQMDMVAGRSFEKGRSSDSTEAILINQAAAAHLALETPVGTRFFGAGGQPLTVIGVVDDFQLGSLHAPVEPLILVPFSFYRYLSVRLAPGDVPGTLAFLEEKWREIAPERPFEYAFLDAGLDRLYKAEDQLGQIFGYLALLTVFIACLGLYGLAAFTTAQRTKEIGVRKVMGASAVQLWGLVTGDFLKLVGLAFVVGAPLAYFVMTRWLSAFAYHVDVAFSSMMLAGVFALVVSLIAVAYHAIRAALTDPAQTLRYE